MEKKRWAKAWGIFFWVCIGVFVLYVVLVLLRARMLAKEEVIQKRVAEIHSIRLTIKDVDGTNLPPEPDAGLNNATVEGIDVNNNYVRDDVERYIYYKYSDIKERAAWMQWAKTVNMLMYIEPNKLQLRAVMEEGSRANICLSLLYVGTKTGLGEIDKEIAKVEDMTKDSLQRKAFSDKVNKEMSSSGPMKDAQQCDIFKEEIKS